MDNADEHRPTHTQPRPNISTEHQADGDARRPSDTLDRDVTRRGPGGRPEPETYSGPEDYTGDGTPGSEPREER